MQFRSKNLQRVEASSLTVVLYTSGSLPGPGTPFCRLLIKIFKEAERTYGELRTAE